jgi:hypothetical protein
MLDKLSILCVEAGITVCPGEHTSTLDTGQLSTDIIPVSFTMAVPSTDAITRPRECTPGTSGTLNMPQMVLQAKQMQTNNCKDVTSYFAQVVTVVGRNLVKSYASDAQREAAADKMVNQTEQVNNLLMRQCVMAEPRRNVLVSWSHNTVNSCQGNLTLV